MDAGLRMSSQTNGAGTLAPLPPPPDVVAPVQAVAQDADAAGALRPAGTPPDVVAAVYALTASGVSPGIEARAMPDDVVPHVHALDAEPPLWAKEPDYADEPVPQPAVAPPALDNDAIYRIVRAVALSHSGTRLYAAEEHDSALGLLYGLALFPQASPHLGSALRLMRDRDGDTFRSVFGPASEELLGVTGAPEVAARLAPVAGEPLDRESWRARFRAAGVVPAFCAAQNEVAIEHQFRPMLATALALGLTTERALALGYDAVVARGVGGGVRWLTGVLGDGPPVGSPSAAIAALVEAATGSARTRLERLRDTTFLTDTALVAVS